MSLASLVEEAVGSPLGVILDDRQQPLFRLVKRLRESDRSVWWQAKVVDAELLEQGAPKDVVLQAVSLGEGLSAANVSRALEACLVDHPRIQLCHSAALPGPVLEAVQPSEPSSLLPPLHWLPLCDKVQAVVLVKEWSDGVPLLSWRAARGASLGLSEIVELVETVCDALGGLHRRGFAHGAMTPDSIALQEWTSPTLPGEPEETVWIPKLVDLGLLRTLAAPGEFPRGLAMRWCAPEAFVATGSVDWRKADQLSLAALLYALWTDQLAFDDVAEGTRPDDACLQRRRQIEALPPPRGNARARSLGVTPAMSAACMRALSADPDDRFSSIEAFAAALRQAGREAKGKVDDDIDHADAGTQPTNPGSYVTSKFRAPVAVEPDTSPDAATPPAPWNPHKEQAKPQEEPEPEPEPLPSVMVAEPERVTRILPHPAADTGGYPAHPDAEPEESSRTSSRSDDLSLAELQQALGSGKWSLNRLAAVFLVLWLVTLAWGLTRGGEEPAPAPSAQAK